MKPSGFLGMFESGEGVQHSIYTIHECTMQWHCKPIWANVQWLCVVLLLKLLAGADLGCAEYLKGLAP